MAKDPKVRPTEPLQLHHSWPLTEIDTRLDLGRLFDAPICDTPDGAAPSPSVLPPEVLPVPLPLPPGMPLGTWSCDLADNRLHWSRDVYRMFGLPEDTVPERCTTVSLYAEPSRAAMERLRAHAIRHRRGFTLDVAILPPGVRRRWVRLVAAPVCEEGRVVRLHGCKSDVTHLYRR